MTFLRVAALQRDLALFSEIHFMDQTTASPNDIFSSTKTYLDRVLANEAARKGIAAAGAGILVAAITEALWPSNR